MALSPTEAHMCVIWHATHFHYQTAFRNEKPIYSHLHPVCLWEKDLVPHNVPRHCQSENGTQGQWNYPKTSHYACSKWRATTAFWLVFYEGPFSHLVMCYLLHIMCIEGGVAKHRCFSYEKITWLHLTPTVSWSHRFRPLIWNGKRKKKNFFLPGVAVRSGFDKHEITG